MWRNVDFEVKRGVLFGCVGKDYFLGVWLNWKFDFCQLQYCWFGWSVIVVVENDFVMFVSVE